MALADIIKRIESDADTEAGQIVASARGEAERLRHEAEQAALTRREHELEIVGVEVQEAVRTQVATARLGGRDRIIGEKRVFIDRAIHEAVSRIESLPADRYAALLAREVAAVVRGGESVLVGTADADRLATALPAALVAAGVDVRLDGATKGLERGVIVQGERMSVEVSIASMAVARRAQLEALAASVLFGERDADA